MLTTDEVNMSSIKDLYTREDNNESVKMYIGDEWISVLGCDSDKFRAKKREFELSVISGKAKPEELSNELIAELITDWSYDEPCTNENKIELIKNSPSLAEAIDRKSSERANFTKRQLAASLNTQKDTSGSGSQQRKAQKSQGKTTTTN